MRSTRDHAIHVIASYVTEHLLKRRRKSDLVDAELEIRDALLAFFESCQAGVADLDRRLREVERAE